MKNIQYIVLLFLAIGYNACSDVLDRAPDGNMPMSEVLADADKVEALLNSCYEGISPKGYSYGGNHNAFLVSASDDAWDSYDEHQSVAISYYYNDQNSAATGSQLDARYWETYWAQIRKCSQFIEYIDLPETAVHKEENRALFKAEARLLRAFFYMELIKWYGKMPILDATMSYEDDFSGLSRRPVYELAKFMAADCDAAIASNIPWRMTVEQEGGRMNKAVAYALKSEALMYAASPLHNEGESHWEEAYQASKDAVDKLKANGYQLYTQCTQPDVFGTGLGAAFRQFSTTDADYSASPRDRETIYQVREVTGWMDPLAYAGIFAGAKDVWHIGYIGSYMPGTFKVGTCPTQELVDAFETTDGQPILNLSRPYLDENHLQPNYNAANTLYDPQNPYENRDPRFYETVLYNGSHIMFQGEGEDANSIVDWEIETYFTIIDDTTVNRAKHAPNFGAMDPQLSRTGYFECKVVVPGACALDQHHSSRWKYYRLGETLLNLAETAAEAGHLAEARTAVNEVRARVNMPEIPNGLSKEELLLRIHNERRVELAWEENRFFDLRRWQKPDGDLSATCKWLTAMVITKDPRVDPVIVTYERRNIWSRPRGGWQNRDLLISIPQKDANLLESATGEKWQNPGW
jgi:hypothetical protein